MAFHCCLLASYLMVDILCYYIEIFVLVIIQCIFKLLGCCNVNCDEKMLSFWLNHSILVINDRYHLERELVCQDTEKKKSSMTNTFQDTVVKSCQTVFFLTVAVSKFTHLYAVSKLGSKPYCAFTYYVCASLFSVLGIMKTHVTPRSV